MTGIAIIIGVLVFFLLIFLLSLPSLIYICAPNEVLIFSGGRRKDLRVVRSGVSADDWIVTKGLQRARPGGKVTPKREPIKLSETAPATVPANAKR